MFAAGAPLMFEDMLPERRAWRAAGAPDDSDSDRRGGDMLPAMVGPAAGFAIAIPVEASAAASPVGLRSRLRLSFGDVGGFGAGAGAGSRDAERRQGRFFLPVVTEYTETASELSGAESSAEPAVLVVVVLAAADGILVKKSRFSVFGDSTIGAIAPYTLPDALSSSPFVESEPRGLETSTCAASVVLYRPWPVPVPLASGERGVRSRSSGAWISFIEDECLSMRGAAERSGVPAGLAGVGVTAGLGPPTRPSGLGGWTTSEMARARSVAPRPLPAEGEASGPSWRRSESLGEGGTTFTSRPEFEECREAILGPGEGAEEWACNVDVRTGDEFLERSSVDGRCGLGTGEDLTSLDRKLGAMMQKRREEGELEA